MHIASQVYFGKYGLFRIQFIQMSDIYIICEFLKKVKNKSIKLWFWFWLVWLGWVWLVWLGLGWDWLVLDHIRLIIICPAYTLYTLYTTTIGLRIIIWHPIIISKDGHGHRYTCSLNFILLRIDLTNYLLILVRPKFHKHPRCPVRRFTSTTTIFSLWFNMAPH